MNDGWKARVVFRPDMIANAVYMTREYGDRREYLTKTGKDYTIVTAKQYETPKEDPIFILLDNSQIQSLAEAINEYGVQAPNEHLIEGKLLATERHLEDMRALALKGIKRDQP